MHCPVDVLLFYCFVLFIITIIIIIIIVIIIITAVSFLSYLCMCVGVCALSFFVSYGNPLRLLITF